MGPLEFSIVQSQHVASGRQPPQRAATIAGIPRRLYYTCSSRVQASVYYPLCTQPMYPLSTIDINLGFQIHTIQFEAT